MKRIGLSIIALGFVLTLVQAQPNNRNFVADVIVYGGTSAAVTAAVQISRMGKTVIIVSPDKHLGGLSSGGLGFTDVGNKAVIGGLSREFYQRVYEHYQQPQAWNWQKKEDYGNKGQGTAAIDGNQRTMWIFEPHVAEAIFEGFVAENHVQVIRNEWLDRKHGVVKVDGKIVSIKTLSGKEYRAKVFVDATYEGDLMAAAGVTYHVGREANAEYGEKWNGVQIGVLDHGHHFKTNISPYKIAGDASSGLLPLVSGQFSGNYGEADKRIQAYCFRLCLTNNAANRIAFPKPANYDASKYELLARVYAAGWNETFDKFDPIPNKKTDKNNHGPVSTDYIGMNYDYPDASYERRKTIIQDHKNYQEGLFYFMGHDPKVPQNVRTEINTWGLVKDEFKDNGNWPSQLYIREARRMIGQYVMTEHNIIGDQQVPKPIGMGSYTLDSHNAQRYVKADGFVQNEGDIGVDPKGPYQIAYGALIPKKEECKNLLVAVCISSSHIAYGSMRMEPVFMILGQVTGTAAVQSIDYKQSVQDIDYNTLGKKLLKDKMVLELK